MTHGLFLFWWIRYFAQQQSCSAPPCLGSPSSPQVKENPALGIPGGWTVRVMWVVNDRQPAWEAALPQDTRSKLQRDRESKLVEVSAPQRGTLTHHACAHQYPDGAVPRSRRYAL